jgi:hypothetical protein
MEFYLLKVSKLTQIVNFDMNAEDSVAAFPSRLNSNFS